MPVMHIFGILCLSTNLEIFLIIFYFNIYIIYFINVSMCFFLCISFLFNFGYSDHFHFISVIVLVILVLQFLSCPSSFLISALL